MCKTQDKEKDYEKKSEELVKKEENNAARITAEKNSYYYDDAHGYEIFDADAEKENDED